jgi:LysR family nitrogen assimilation transcriptional regulator
LGLPPTLGRSVTVPLVKAFDRQLPNARLATVEGLSAYMLEWLNLGRIDCALVYNALGSPTLDLQPLLDEQLFLIAPLPARGARKSPKSVTLAELGDYPLNIPSRPHAVRMSVETALAGVEVKINVAHEIESIPAIIDLVRQGHGYAVLPLNAVKSTPWSDEVLVKPILAPLLKTTLCIATSAQRPKSPLLRKAVDVVREVVRQEIRSAEKLT